MPIVCNPQRFYLEFRKFTETKDLVFVNSVGGIEAIRLRGLIDANADYTQTSAQKIETPEYFTNGILDAQTEDIVNFEQESFTGDTGFMPKENLDRLRDLINASKLKKAFEIKNNRLIPINIRSKTIQWYTNRQSLFSIALQWQYAFTNQYFTPAGLINAAGTCPPVESFAVVQSGRDKLTITWALETGYNQLQVEVLSPASSLITLEGNSGQVEIPFANPATDAIGTNITVHANTVCNNQQDPPDVGPQTTVTVRVYPNQAPVARTDYYQIPQGHATAVTLSGSVMDNDYDPNGDDFEVVPSSGVGSNGGAYSIDKFGIVKYTPPSGIWVGIDLFPYTITESGAGALTATGNIYVFVMPVVSAAPVYVKVAARNGHRTKQSTGIVNTLYKYYEQVYLEFFSDAAGTNPVDVTGVGLIVSVRRTRYDHSTSTTEDTAYPVTGFELKFFDGECTEYNTSGSIDWHYAWDVLPGTGYGVI
jgi:hypothetical protein